ncbi:MAG: hypothetical protein HOY75_13380 [Streptomyces sp.]|nr:hypothetical protein [Streptomyces sp.]
MTTQQALTDQQLDEIQARADVATDGPWERYEKYGPDFFACTSGSYLRGVGSFNFGDGTDAAADEEFVKHAVQDVRALLAELRRQRAILPAIIAALQKRAGELQDLAEEQMRPSLEERAQEWLEAAETARRAAVAASRPADSSA